MSTNSDSSSSGSASISSEEDYRNTKKKSSAIRVKKAKSPSPIPKKSSRSSKEHRRSTPEPKPKSSSSRSASAATEPKRGRSRSKILDSPQLQIINEHQEFNENLEKYMNEVWRLAGLGFNYNMVAVFGSQSTGKSTLLNALFETHFDTMGDGYRQQTTKGLWASMAKNSNTIVMDVEGVDGRERGEDQDFERKSALFSLAVSQVLLVNIWESQVGLYNGANMGLLKTVFEVNLELFQQNGRNKTLLFFVIRDHIGSVPLNRLAETVSQDLNKAWGELAKPKGLERCKIDEFFDFMFFGLPHKVLLPEEFDEQAQVLRQFFYDPKHPSYVFRSQYHKQIPADGFSTYAANIWEQIVTNKDLDLPTQQQLLAQFRCDEIAAGLMNNLVTDFAPKKELVDKGEVIENLGETFKELKIRTIGDFDTAAGRYNAEVYKKKREDLVVKVNDYFLTYFKAQLSSLVQMAFTTFTKAVDAGLKEVGYKFTEVTDSAMEKARAKFTRWAKNMILDESTWSYSKEKQQLNHDMTEYTKAKCKAELTKVETVLVQDMGDQLEDTMPTILSAGESNLWQEVLEEFLHLTNLAETKMKEQANQFSLEEEEINERIADMRVRGWKTFVRRVKDEVADTMLLAKLRRRLEEAFRYDAEGLPRVWKPDDDIDHYFKEAKVKAIELIPLLSKIRVEDSKMDFDGYFKGNTLQFDARKTLIVISMAKRGDLETRFKREADAIFLEAKRGVVSTTNKIPYWVLIVILMLGWNEILYVLTSPFTFLMGLIGGVGFYVAYITNMIGPISRVLEVLSKELIVLAKKAMDEAQKGEGPLGGVSGINSSVRAPLPNANSSGESMEARRERRAQRKREEEEAAAANTESSNTLVDSSTRGRNSPEPGSPPSSKKSSSSSKSKK